MPLVIEEEVKNKMRPELELILSCARAKSPENEERIKELFGAGLDWSEVLASAIQHKLVPVLYDRFRAMQVDRLTQLQKEAFADLARKTTQGNLAFLGEMLRLHSLFKTARIPAIPFKGPALARLAYPNFAQRTCVDLDFVVPQRFIPEATALLQTHGFTPQFSPMEAQAGRRDPAPGQYAFAPKGNHCFVEIHTERTLRYFSRPVDLDEMNSRTIRMEIAGQEVCTFSVEDLLVMLCVHGAKHFWERLAWIVDIAQLIAVREVDWPLLMQIAGKLNSTRLLLLGLYLAHEMIGAPLPQTILRRAQSDANVRWLAGRVLEQYSGNSDPSVGVWPRAIFRLKSCDRYPQGLLQLFRLSLSPTERDRQTIRLPGVLSPLYGLVRLFRLMSEYGLRGNRRLKPDLAVYQPTPDETVFRMLQFAGVSPGDVLYDLGCGDGRIVVAAAEKYGIRAVGVDINSARIAEARANARRHGVEDRVRFVLGDAKMTDFSEATVVTMYLGADGNLRLVNRLRSDLRSGARIVSRDFQIYGWVPERIEDTVLPNGLPTSFYLWTIKNPGQESRVRVRVPPGDATVG